MRQLSERLQKQRAEREASQARIDTEMCADTLSQGLRRKAYDYAWEEQHSSGFTDVEGMYSDILEMLIIAQTEGTDIVLGGP